MTKISIVTVNYNSYKYVDGLINSIVYSLVKCGNCLEAEVIVVDNSSLREDYNKLHSLQNKYKIDIKIWRNRANLGYAGAVNVGVRLATGDVVAVSNPDIILDEGFMSELYSIIDKKFIKNKIIAPKILLKKGGIVNSKGLDMHIAGYGILRGLGDANIGNDRASPVIAPHGALFIGDKDTLESLGPFDPHLYAFLEDLDLGLRAWARGIPTVYYPRLTAYHDWGVSWGRGLSAIKYYLAERNRLIVLARDVPGRLLGVSLPFIALSEMLSGAYALQQGYLGLKARIYGDFLKLLRKITRERRHILEGRGEAILYYLLMRKMIYDFHHVVFEEHRVAAVNRVFRGLLRLLRPLVRPDQGDG